MSVEILGRWGFGDELMTRAVIRELMKTQTVYLRTPYPAMFRDLIEQGLKISEVITNAPLPYAHAIRQSTRDETRITPAPGNVTRLHIAYERHGPLDIRKHGSILAAMFFSVGLKMPEKPDLSFPVPEPWRLRARKLIETGGKPLMVYRPLVSNNTFGPPNRLPDPTAYATLFNAIRERFFIASIANIQPNYEGPVGEAVPVDADFSHGELDFETLCGLFAESSLVFCTAGFTPLLAHAIQAPVVIVYGGHESSKLQAPTIHLSPTLAIEPDHPCNCQNPSHNCDRHITLSPARARLLSFVGRLSLPVPAKPEPPRVLICATTYTPNADRAQLLDYWIAQVTKLNPGCDILLVDTPSATLPKDYRERFHETRGTPPAHINTGTLQSSPIDPRHGEFVPYTPGLRAPRMIHRFADNIGHLWRWRFGERDGWGRAFCFAISAGIASKYDFIVHIEGDALFRHSVAPVIQKMQQDSLDAVSALVDNGHPTRHGHPRWVETGLLFMRTKFLVDLDFVAKYNWEGRRNDKPAPEEVIYHLFGEHLVLMPWVVFRGHLNSYTHKNIETLDFITHADADQSMYARFMEFPSKPLAMTPIGRGAPEPYPPGERPLPRPRVRLVPQPGGPPQQVAAPRHIGSPAHRAWELEMQRRGIKA